VSVVLIGTIMSNKAHTLLKGIILIILNEVNIWWKRRTRTHVTRIKFGLVFL
jgi:hypothetical protein